MLMMPLDDLMEFDHVIYSYGDGANAEVTDINTPYFEGEDCLEEGWELLQGFTGQYDYNGPAMHPSEYVGGGLARYILENPGYYVTLYWFEYDDDGEEYDEGLWYVARKVEA